MLQYQQSLNYHFALGLELKEYVGRGLFREAIKATKIVDTYSASAILAGIDLGNFFKVDKRGRAIIPGSMAAIIISSTKNFGDLQERQKMLIDFSEKYLQLQNQKYTPDSLQISINDLPILSHPALEPDLKAALHKQIFYHLVELDHLRQNNLVEENSPLMLQRRGNTAK